MKVALIFFILIFGGTVYSQQDNNWKKIGYGGGGAMFYPAVSPFDPNYAFVSCDMTGSYVTHNGGGSWRMFNLRSPVDFFVFDPSDSNTIYAHSIGLFKSSDKGSTWKLFYPSSSEVKGIVAQGDHAQELLVTTDSTVRVVNAFAIDPVNSSKMYAGITIDNAPAIYYSSNGGASWKKLHDLREPAKDIFLSSPSPANDRTLYICSKSGITVRDSGRWTFNPAPVEVNQLTHYSGGYNKTIPGFIIYAIAGKSYFDADGTGSGIYFTNNGGKTWENREAGLTSLGDTASPAIEYRTVATSAHNPGSVYISYNNLRKSADTSFIGVAKSDDFGKTWQLAWKDIITSTGNRPSENFEPEWINIRFGPTWGENPFSIGVSPANPEICYATDFGRTVKTTDGGKTWQQVYTNKDKNGGWVSRGLDVTTGYLITPDPFDKNTLYMCNTDIGLMKSIDGGKSWNSITQNNGIPRKWQNSTYWLQFDPKVKRKAWAAMSGIHDLPRPKMFRRHGVADFNGGIVMTEDEGKTWKVMSSSIGEAAITHILLDRTGKYLYACAFGKGVYRSADGGNSWVKKSEGIAGKEPFAWRITERHDGVLFLVVNRRSDDGSIGNEGDGALYTSSDSGENWKPVLLPNGTNGPMCVITSVSDKSRLILSAWGKANKTPFGADTGGGIFISEDDGKNWKNVMSDDQHIHDITYDSINKVHYACGFNSSAYSSKDNGEHWNRIKGYNFKWGKRVDPDPADPSKIYIITFGGGFWHGPAEGDADAIEDIVTPIVAY